MYQTGLVSISFRTLSPEQIVKAMVGCGLKYVEWGSDVHAPCTDDARLAEVAQLQQQYGVTCCSYGTYFRLGVNPVEEFTDYLKAAKVLGTKMLRIWAGKGKVEVMTPEWRKMIIEEGKKVARLAEEAGLIVCTECHRNTMTETKEFALELMEGVNSPAFRTYWQPNPSITLAENLEYIQLLKPYVTNLHVFHRVDDKAVPLALGEEDWKAYFAEFSHDRAALLEFMPDGLVESLPTEAATLLGLVGQA